MITKHNDIYITGYRIIMEVYPSPVSIRRIMSDFIRDGLGESLRRNFCLLNNNRASCHCCGKSGACSFTRLFMPKDKTGNEMPRPFILFNVNPSVEQIENYISQENRNLFNACGENTLMPGETFTFDMTLIGNNRFEFFLEALMRLKSSKLHGLRLKSIMSRDILNNNFFQFYQGGSRFFNNKRFPFTLENAEKIAKNFRGDKISVNFQSQTRIKKSGNYITGTPSFKDMFNSVINRIKRVQNAYFPELTLNFKDEILEIAGRIKTDKSKVRYTNNLSRHCSQYLKVNSIRGWDDLIGLLKNPSTKEQQYVLGRLGKEFEDYIQDLEDHPGTHQRRTIIHALNKLLNLTDLYNPEIFDGDNLNKELKAALQNRLPESGIKDFSRFNRLLLNHTFKGRIKNIAQYMHLNGIIGEVIYQGPQIEKLLPFLIFGSYLQIGKNTVSGCGKYSLGTIQ